MTETPAEIRDRANDLAMESLLLHRLAVLRSGEWRELGFASFDAWAASKNERHRIALSVPERRELVAELTAEGRSRSDIAAVVDASESTVKRDRGSFDPRTESKGQVTGGAAGSNDPDILAEREWRQLHDDTERGRSAVEDFVEAAQSVQDARYVAAFAKTLVRIGDPLTFDAERLGPLLDEVHLEILTGLTRSITELERKLTTSRRRIRVVNGGRK